MVVERAATAHCHQSCASTVLFDCVRASLGSQLGQSGLYIGGAQFRKVLQLVVEPRHIEQVPSGAFRWRFLKERLFQKVSAGLVHSALAAQRP